MTTNNTTTTFNENSTTIKLHQTNIVTFNDDQIILDNGDHKSKTTKIRMNQASERYDLGFRVFQTGKRWFVNFNGKDHAWEGLTIKLDRKAIFENAVDTECALCAKLTPVNQMLSIVDTHLEDKVESYCCKCAQKIVNMKAAEIKHSEMWDASRKAKS